MLQTYIIPAICFLVGFIAAFIIQMISIAKLKKELNSIQGFLESEKLMKETFKKENSTLHGIRQASEGELIKKLQAANAMIKKLDDDILLLQKNNEETEMHLQITQPELHAIKLKLIEAQNTIGRYKAQLGK